MGTEISGLVLEPAIAVGIIALCVLAIVEQNRKNVTKAEWSAIGAILATFGLIAVNVIVAVFV